ncbi:MAG: hypothetical protein ACXWFC_02495 [Nitrososphaeraceae archaeon]
MEYIKAIVLSALFMISISLISGTSFGQLAIPTERTLAIIGSDGLLFGLSEIETDEKNLSVEIATPFAPDEDQEFEAWFVDDKRGGSAYYLNLGAINENGTLNYNEHLINPLTYTHLEITSEPANDLDPRPATRNIVGTAELVPPFGR